MKTNRPLPQNKIEKGKIKRIWGCAAALQIEEPLLRTVIFGLTGSNSISNLTNAQGQTVINHLQDMIKKQLRTDKRKSKNSQVVKMEYWQRTEEQDSLIDDLLQKINDTHEKINLELICSRMFKKSRNALNRREAQAIIEALKSIYSRYGA